MIGELNSPTTEIPGSFLPTQSFPRSESSFQSTFSPSKNTQNPKTYSEIISKRNNSNFSKKSFKVGIISPKVA